MQELAHQFLDGTLVPGLLVAVSEQVNVGAGVQVGLLLGVFDKKQRQVTACDEHFHEAAPYQLQVQVMKSWRATHVADVLQSLRKQRVVVAYQVVTMSVAHFLCGHCVQSVDEVDDGRAPMAGLEVQLLKRFGYFLKAL
jgi:hypothetical protein